MKPQREWFLQVPWGKMALKSYGHPDGEPVFVVHGRQDSLSVFDPLIEQMSHDFYYVALDMPGNGLSDAFPHGPKLQRFHFLYAMELAILHLGWDKFIFMGHSMGCEQGLFFNAIHPDQITKMILLDAGPTLMRMQVDDNEEYQRTFYDHYYDNYKRECFSRKRYSFMLAKQAIMRVRDLTEAQCAHILSRNFKDLGYLSWDNRLKNLAPQNYGNDYYFELFKKIPPTLLIAASNGAKNVPPNPKWRQGAKELLDKMATLENFQRVDVEGSHDVHYTHPERVLPYINAFLKDNKVSSKL